MADACKVAAGPPPLPGESGCRWRGGALQRRPCSSGVARGSPSHPGWTLGVEKPKRSNVHARESTSKRRSARKRAHKITNPFTPPNHVRAHARTLTRKHLFASTRPHASANEPIGTEVTQSTEHFLFALQRSGQYAWASLEASF